MTPALFAVGCYFLGVAVGYPFGYVVGRVDTTLATISRFLKRPLA